MGSFYTTSYTVRLTIQHTETPTDRMGAVILQQLRQLRQYTKKPSTIPKKICHDNSSDEIAQWAISLIRRVKNGHTEGLNAGYCIGSNPTMTIGPPPLSRAMGWLSTIQLSGDNDLGVTIEIFKKKIVTKGLPPLRPEFQGKGGVYFRLVDEREQKLQFRIFVGK